MAILKVRGPTDRRGRRIRPPTAIIGAVIYVGFAVAAYLLYPSSFSPLHNWLSDLGNRDLNPAGAYFYIVGCAITGALLIAFYLSLRTWVATGSKRQRRQIAWVRGFGSLAGFALIMTAAFPEDQLVPHQWWNRVLFGSIAPALFLSMFAFWRGRNASSILVSITAACAYLADTAWFVFHDVFWLQWVTVSLIITHICVVTAAARRLATDRRRPVSPPRPPGVGSAGDREVAESAA